MVKLSGMFNRLNACRVLVAGDLLLDSYTIGKAHRISPEAPVAVIHVQSEEHLAGGAGNVMLNLASLGATVVALGRVGNDIHGSILKNCLSSENILIDGLVHQNAYFTPVKNRIIAENQQIVRVDHEKIIPLNEQLEQEIIDNLENLLSGVQVVAISDYGKGFLTKSLLEALIATANKLNIPTITDPKGTDFSKYAGTTFIKPNFGEAVAASHLSKDAPLEKIATAVLEKAQAKNLIITRSESGISTFDHLGNREDFPVVVREVKDVTGAGDTVLAMLSVAIANTLSLQEAVRLSNIAAGIAIEHIGCARITLCEIAKRLLEVDVHSKVFDGDHVFALKEALKNQKFNLLCLSSKDGFNSKIYSNIKELKNTNEKLIVYIHEDEPDSEMIDILSSLREVDYIILCAKSLKNLVKELHPSRIIQLDGEKLFV